MHAVLSELWEMESAFKEFEPLIDSSEGVGSDYCTFCRLACKLGVLKEGERASILRTGIQKRASPKKEAEMHLYLAELHYAKGDMDAALEAVNASLRRSPNALSSCIQAVGFVEKLNCKDEADEALEDWIRRMEASSDFGRKALLKLKLGLLTHTRAVYWSAYLLPRTLKSRRLRALYLRMFSEPGL